MISDQSDFDEMFARQLQAEFDAEEIAAAGGSSTSHATLTTSTMTVADRIHSISSDSDETLSEEEMDRLMITSRKASKRSTVLTEDSAASAKKPRYSASVDSRRPLCRYDPQCYRKNEEHRKRFRHTCDADDTDDRERGDQNISRELRTTSAAFEQLYLTSVAELRPAHNRRTIAISLADILAEPIGNLKSSAQFNYMFEVDWLVHQYPTEHRKKPLLLVHGERHQAKRALEKQVSLYNHARLCQAPLPDIFGTHHTKMMLLLYDEGLRIVIHTANLVRGDWHQKTQGVWMSPLFPSMEKVEGTARGDSETKFKRDLLSYLASYSCRDLDGWTNIVRNHDMSTAKVFLVASVPGRHSGERKNFFGHLKLRSILKGSNGPLGSVVDHHWPVVGQFSSIGSLGSDAKGWLCGEWLNSFTSSSTSASASTLTSKVLKLIFPSVDNVRTSLEGYPAGVSLPYSKENEAKQPWLRAFLHQWRCEAHGRSSASPHIKTYLRMSPDQSRIAWMLITSANLSKAAWGNLEKGGSQLHIRSYEIGVLFLPSHFKPPISATDAHMFCPDDILVPFDLPVTPYAANDQPWTWNAAHTDKPDRHGNVWQPT